MHSFVVVAVALISAVFILDSISDLLNMKRLRDPLPDEFQDVYDSKGYERALLYQLENTRLDLFRRTVFYAVTLAFLWAEGFGVLDRMIRSFGWSDLVTGLAFLGLLSFLRFLLSLPFSLYEIFALEQEFGFNRMTPGLFVSDLLKGALLSTLLGVPIYACIYLFFTSAGNAGWLIAWAVLTVIQVILMYLAPAIILPLFNKFVPLPDGPLRQAIGDYAKQRNFSLSGIFTMDSSKRSTKSNAFFTGFGKTRRLVLFDSLIEKHTPEELVAIVAHEVGHFEKKHIIKSLFMSLLPTAAIFYLIAVVNDNIQLFSEFGFQTSSIHGGLILVSLFISPILRVLNVLIHKISRKFEYEADEFSVETYKNPRALISALKKLSIDNMAHLTPHPLKVVLDYTHPSVLERIKALQKLA